MKVIHIIENILAGGRERRLMEFLKASNGRKNLQNYVVVLSDDIFFTEVTNMHCTIISRKKHNDIYCLCRLYKLIKEYHPDIIHAWGELAACYATVVKLLLRKKMVNGMVSSASDRITMKRRLYGKLSFPFSDIILSNSYAGVKAFNITSNNVKIVYNGFNIKRLNTIKPCSDIREYYKIKTKYIVGMIANFTAHKDYDTYLQAARKILQKRNDITFICVGEGNNMGIKQTKSMHDYQEEYADNNIIFTGMQKDVESIVNILDIGVLTSHGEAISNSILEYMAFSKPVIATDKGGTSEIVENSKNGYLVEYKNVEELASRIEELVDNIALRKIMGERSKNIINEKFNIDTMVDKYIDIYSSIMQ